MEAEPGAVLLQVVGVNGRHPLTQILGSGSSSANLGFRVWGSGGGQENGSCYSIQSLGLLFSENGMGRNIEIRR